MSSAETEGFLKHLAATVPPLEEPEGGNLISYQQLCESVSSYLISLRAESFELPVALRRSEEMLLYQARQITVLEFWGLSAHAAFPPPPESSAAKYRATALYRIKLLTGREDKEPESISPLKQIEQAPSPQKIREPTTPDVSVSPFRISFRKPQASIKSRSYRKQKLSHEDSEIEQQTTSPQLQDLQKSPALPAVARQSSTTPHPSFASCIRKEDDQSARVKTSSDPQKMAVNTSQPIPHVLDGNTYPANPLSIVTGAVENQHTVPPIWPSIKLQDSWDPLTGFPSGSFVFSTNKAFARIIGPITPSVKGEIIAKVNDLFPLLRLRWERTPMKADGRKDLAVWVEFGIGVSRTDRKAVEQRDMMIAGLLEFYQRDVLGAEDYLHTFFKRNIERLQA
ncbi:hypothetical protein ONS95_012825 [Cadophora gregata]|uniref:uncharacterized protein n=1 Tax=Cadophora gregata TaxID=51156 RepID=UPI0026DC5D41|nr:uncharacterized protein ONS95_012825 [Cadophora gregata]KAK0101194.1 hypothetical protein ONS96_006415 [Cadophora gregata f. sp. sojae]KAK0115772.1 hypothetical protein ONS95_012825 [Cadophora gregata]